MNLVVDNVPGNLRPGDYVIVLDRFDIESETMHYKIVGPTVPQRKRLVSMDAPPEIIFTSDLTHDEIKSIPGVIFASRGVYESKVMFIRIDPCYDVEDMKKYLIQLAQQKRSAK
jgi:hypothetical protein